MSSVDEAELRRLTEVGRYFVEAATKSLNKHLRPMGWEAEPGSDGLHIFREIIPDGRAIGDQVRRVHGNDKLQSRNLPL